ncbi:protein SAWADEE HOMEODOMAIN HOMOLOG 1-like isoform X2 [Prosopis cineraria]|uniref:protein SAWADEE HOMEODOMAIN HOMOLOG 1-like isoform X2 n=1 Tax=Prosopis cineraria TaxID=364024 RepID=UPI00240FC818|nr:protein SAWADEE HOMEODOMAIN HOMOLOG 1-like isoform X2 [Prosopis cineraria]
MEDLGSTVSSHTEFFLAEMVQLENIYKEMGEKSLSLEFCQGLANSFSSSLIRAGKDPICCEQVRDWFRNKQKEPKAEVPSPANSPKLVGSSDASTITDELETCPNPKDVRVPDISELAFEARSSKDAAWYDVESFVSYRVVNSTGELEVRVRYAGFSKNQDEWVNVKESIRERSIPLVPSECDKVKEGDLMLCFQERYDYAVYCDARVVKIQRRPHDQTDCRCIFLVRYSHDNSEEVVQWNRLCRRPALQQPVVSINPIADLWG